MPTFSNATVIDHQCPANNFHHLRLRPHVSNFSFQAGQYIVLKVAAAQINKYSLAGAPGKPEFELIVDTTPGQRGSQYVESLQLEETVEFLGPLGIFTLKPDDGSQHFLFIATGSGIAPLKSMVEELLIHRQETCPITLYFGLRYPQDVFLEDHFRQLAKLYNNFEYVLTISRPDAQWAGQTGRVTEHLKKNFPSTVHCSAYLCGSGSMINDTEQLLLGLGTPAERIYYEKFYD